MSKEKPEVGDVWKNPKNEKVYIIVDVAGSFVGVISKSFFGQDIPKEFLIKEFAYLGKSKANINDLFEVEENDI